ncbi:MAG TPA: helix-turn-helix domain-containing protein [Propionibacteriaceae bacterium]
MYAERPSVVHGATAWRSEGAGPSRVLPDGCLDLLWLDGQLVVAGPDTTAFVSESGGDGVVGLRFASGIGPAVFGVPADELADQRVPLVDLWSGPVVRVLTDRLATATDQLAVLESVATDRLQQDTPDPAMLEVARSLAAGTGVGTAADRVGLSERQLRRRSYAAFGYGPKTLGRILRLGRALDLARAGTAYASCAAQAGYADQAHLARDVRALTGTTLGDLVG